MRDDAGYFEQGASAIAQIASAPPGPTGHNDHIRGSQAFVDQVREHDLVIRPDAELLWNTARFLYRRSDDRGVRIVNRARAYRLPRRDNLVTGRDDGNARPPPHCDGGGSDRCKHADLA